MQSPNVATQARDSTNNITYTVMAYRKLTPAECTTAVRTYLAQAKKKPKRGSAVTIISIIGFDDG